MASQPAPLLSPAVHARRWIDDYRARCGSGDVLGQGDDAAWAAMFEELATVASDDFYIQGFPEGAAEEWQCSGHGRERVLEVPCEGYDKVSQGHGEEDDC